jgi:hypothetical protein
MTCIQILKELTVRKFKKVQNTQPKGIRKAQEKRLNKGWSALNSLALVDIQMS